MEGGIAMKMKLTGALLLTATTAFVFWNIDESVFETYTDSRDVASAMLLVLMLLFIVPTGPSWARVFHKFGRKA